jgi:hypothetical protein
MELTSGSRENSKFADYEITNSFDSHPSFCFP